MLSGGRFGQGRLHQLEEGEFHRHLRPLRTHAVRHGTKRIGPDRIAGAVTGGATGAANLTLSIPLSAAAIAQAQASGALSIVVRLTGDAVLAGAAQPE